MRAVNLIPQDQRGTVSAAGRSGGGAYAVLGVVGGLALLALLYGIAKHEISDNKSKAADLSARATKAEAAATQLAPYTSFIAVRESRIQAVSLLMGTRFDWAHSLHELGRVLPKDASVSSIAGTVGSSSASASGAKSASAPSAAGSTSVASATPAGTVPTLTLNGCATSQGEVALVLQRLRLMDGVSEVKLASSTKSSSGAASTGAPGSCAPNDPAFVANVAFDPLPAPAAPSAPSTTLTANAEGSGGTSATGGAR
ncbi:MAG TPA: hypothetical protein VH115_01030 [Solirubrobacteraceae bacterium]|nr:hypothetical protein [Solirubrobacteraceae bacterium]